MKQQYARDESTVQKVLEMMKNAVQEVLETKQNVGDCDCRLENGSGGLGDEVSSQGL